MKQKTIKYILIILIITYGCNRHWVRTENSDQIIWKKMSLNKNYVVNEQSFYSVDSCSLRQIDITQSGTLDNYKYYEFDSIRIYIDKSEKLLIQLTEKGLISGKSFFSPSKRSYCQPTLWANPKRSDYNNWGGFNIFIENLIEIKTISMPNRLKREIDLYKIFKFSFRYIGQPFVNPETFRIEIINRNYKFNQDTVSFDRFINEAELTKIYQR